MKNIKKYDIICPEKGVGRMEIINFSQKQLNNLTKLSLPNEVVNTESIIYKLDFGKWKFKDKHYLLKKLHVTNGSSMANKLYNISLLGDYGKNLGIDELVIPQHLGVINKQPCAFTVLEIEGENLGTIIHNPKISNEEKIGYLYQIGKLLKRTKGLKIQNSSFCFGDLHEYNFVVSNKDKKCYAVDLDSCYLDTKNPQASYYLTTNPNLHDFPRKYKSNTYGITYPTHNTDLLCYNMMILNMISRDKISKLDIPTYFDYIHYLKELGFGKDIIHSFQNIYSTAQNLNPCEHLDQIPLDKIGEAGMKIFTLKQKKRGRI